MKIILIMIFEFFLGNSLNKNDVTWKNSEGL